MDPQRRRILGAGLAGCCLCGTRTWGTALPTNLPPLVGKNYQPVDADERGLWQSLERLEEDLASSSVLLNAPDLQGYTTDVVSRLLGRPPTDLRVYLVREASFNASMTPTGMMIVQSGFMARVRSEAQFAAVLGHECGHYFRKHTIQSYRDARTKSSVMAFVAAGANVAAGTVLLAGGNGAVSWIDAAYSINAGLVSSLFQLSRALESEADAYGIQMMAQAGYEPAAAAQVWKQLIEERQRSAQFRNRKFRPNRVDVFSTHPPEHIRMQDLLDTSQLLRDRKGAGAFEEGAERWRAVMRPHRAELLEEQIRLNDPGASLYLLESHAADSGWDGQLRFLEGEVYRQSGAEGDRTRAAEAYAAAVAFEDAPAAAWKAHGYDLIKADRPVEGKAALNRYLELMPDAADASMVRYTINQE